MRTKTLASIEKQINKLKAEAAKVRSQEVAGVIGRIQEAIKHYGLTAADLGFGKAGKAAGKASAKTTTPGVAKYMDKATGKTWTGRGKPPAWIAKAADRSVFLISGSSAVTSAPKRGGVAKYIDKATGKTWTGMGKPPAWIAGAKDRSAYLIEASKGESQKAEAPAEAAPVAAEAAANKPMGRAKRATGTGRRAGAKAIAKKATTKGRAVKKARAASAANTSE